MDDVAPIFRKLLSRNEKMDNIKEDDVLDEYIAFLKDEESYLYDLYNLVGPEIFLVLVEYFGGLTLSIPKPSEILRKSKRFSNYKENLSDDGAES